VTHQNLGKSLKLLPAKQPKGAAKIQNNVLGARFLKIPHLQKGDYMACL